MSIMKIKDNDTIYTRIENENERKTAHTQPRYAAQTAQAISKNKIVD